MKNKNWELFLLTIFLCEACSSNEVINAPDKPKDQKTHVIPSKGFNQFYRDWDY